MHVSLRTSVVLSALAFALLTVSATPPAHAGSSPLASQLDKVKVAHAKLNGTFHGVKLAPGAAPAGLAAVSADAAALANLTGALATQAKKAGAKDDLLLKLGEIKVESTRVSSQAAALLKKKQLTTVDVQAMASAVAKLQSQYAAVLGLIEPIITR